MSIGKAFKIGYGYDSHRFLNQDEREKLAKTGSFSEKTEYFSEEKKLIIGGVELAESEQKKFGPFKARSDGDVLYHAVVNALLSAIGDKNGRDIGQLFPNTEEKYSNKDSRFFIEEAVKRLLKSDYECVELKIMFKGKPKVDFSKVEKNLEGFFKGQKIHPDIHVQATSGEEMDAAGNGLGVEVMVVCLLQHKNLCLSS